MTSRDSSVSFHINYSRPDCISHSLAASAQSHPHTHTYTHPQRSAATGRCPCLKFNTLRDLYPFSIPHPEFITVTHTYTPIIIFIILAGASPTSLPKFLSKGAPIWLLMTFISLPLSLPRSTYCIPFSSPSHCVCSQTCPLFVFPLIFLSVTHIQTLCFMSLYLSRILSCTVSRAFPSFLPLFFNFFICHSFLITPSLCFISIQSKKMALGVICASRR